MLTSRQIKLAAKIFSNKVIELNELISDLSISKRTIQEEVRIINETFDKNEINITFISKTNSGYTYDDSNFSKKELELKKQCLLFSDNHLALNIENPRVKEIMFLLLLEDDFVKSMNISNALYISDTTLSNDLKEVRKILKNYDLEIVSVPYKGMAIQGETNAKLSCLIDYCNLYNPTNSPDYLGSDCYEMLQITKESILDTKLNLNNILNEKNYRIPRDGFIRILFYLHLADRLKIQPVSYELKSMLDELSVELSIAKTMLSTKDINKLYNLAAFIFINADFNHNQLDKTFNHSIFQSSYTELNEFIATNIGIHLKDSKQFKRFIQKLILTEYIKDRMNFYHYAYSKEKLKLASHLNITNAIAFIIICKLETMFLNSMTTNNLLVLSLHLYNIIATITSPYDKINILMVNNHALDMNQSFAYRVDLDTKYVQLHHHYEHELEQLDLSQYHAIISTSHDLIVPEEYKIPYFKLDYYSDEKTGKKIWDEIVVANKRENLIGERLPNITLKESKSNRNVVIDYLINKLSLNVPYTKIPKNKLKKWWDFSLLLNSNGPIYLYSFHNAEKSTVEKIDFKMDYDSSAKTIYYFNLNLNYKYLTIKQADSIIRGFA